MNNEPLSVWQQRTQQNKRLFAIVVILIFADVTINSFELHSFSDENKCDTSKITVLFGAQIIIQLIVATINIYLLVNTFAFRSGLVKLLIGKFRITFGLEIIYLVTSFLFGIYRLVRNIIFYLLSD